MIDSTAASKTGQSAVLAAIKQAAGAAGVDFQYLLQTAKRESSLNADAKAKSSSASGLFQFTDETWLRVVDRYGARHGLSAAAQAINVSGNKASVSGEMSRKDILALRFDPEVSARMAGELARENAGILEKKLGRVPTSAELYVAHFMGPSDASRMIQAARAGEKGSAADMFPSAAQANPNVFATKGEELSPSQLYRKLTGVEIAAADAGQVAAAKLDTPDDAVSGMTTAMFSLSDAHAEARIAVVQMTTSLMSALFDLQSDRK